MAHEGKGNDGLVRRLPHRTVHHRQFNPAFLANRLVPRREIALYLTLANRVTPSERRYRGAPLTLTASLVVYLPDELSWLP